MHIVDHFWFVFWLRMPWIHCHHCRQESAGCDGGRGHRAHCYDLCFPPSLIQSLIWSLFLKDLLIYCWSLVDLTTDLSCFSSASHFLCVHVCQPCLHPPYSQCDSFANPDRNVQHPEMSFPAVNAKTDYSQIILRKCTICIFMSSCSSDIFLQL